MIKSSTARVLFILTLCCATILGWGICYADDGFYVIPVVKNPPAPVPNTGQLGCWTENGTYRGCYGTGQDYDYEAGAKWPEPRFGFTQGGYRDRLTGLIWQTNANNGPMKWEEALNFCNTLPVIDTETFVLYDDWRLPNIRELHSLVDYGRSTPALPYLHPFIIVDAAFWWSSTTYDWVKSEAWYVRFGDGKVDHSAKDSPELRAWCVRSGL